MKGETAEIPLKENFSGTLKKDERGFFLRPDDGRLYKKITIKREHLLGGAEGDKAYIRILVHGSVTRLPSGKVLKVLGRAGKNDVEMEAITLDQGFRTVLPKKVAEEAKKIKARGIRSIDYENREDFRKIFTFTIDPDTAKDFDDAISFRTLSENEYEIGIHIADVTHYVKPSSVLDEEARERGTSIYLVDRTIPMLPEVLSNDLCSLMPGKDRLTMSAVFILDKNALIQSARFGRSVIHSQKRFTYEEADKTIKDPNTPFHRELSVLNTLAKKLTKYRFDQGAVLLDQEEVKFVLDGEGRPIQVVKKIRGDASQMIEEFMLLANKKVAEEISPRKVKGISAGGVAIYRVHDLPSPEKTADLVLFLESLGHRITLEDGLIPTYEINNLLAKLSGRSEKDTIHRAIIRSMAKAVYSTKNIGHYGLAFKHYTHFTSPIRRYPDMLVHRILAEHLAGHKIPATKLHAYEEMSYKASEQERRAAEAERASVKYKQVEFMSSRIGKIFDGIISGVTEWGIYVEEIESKSEGLVRLRDLEDDFYIFNAKKMELVGDKNKRKYRLGQKVRIKVRATDLERKTIDYILV